MVRKTYLNTIYLDNYRNFNSIKLDCSQDIVIIRGKNGVGKTNILEAISLLSLGKGIRSANYDEICKIGQDHWVSKFIMKSKLGLAEIITNYDLSSKGKLIYYNGIKIKNNELSNIVNIVWLTPQMDSIFLANRIDRKKLLDRIVYNFDANHAKNIMKYDYYMKERLRCLRYFPSMLNSSFIIQIEQKMSMYAQDIHIARNNILQWMQESIDSIDFTFLKVKLSISNLFFENQDKLLLQNNNFIDVYTKALENTRVKDRDSGKTNFGIHKVDLFVTHPKKNNTAKFCSTGEQKEMLIAIIFAQINTIIRKTETTPIVLLDELFVRLDDHRKAYLADYLCTKRAQTFITTTDLIGVKNFYNSAQVIEVKS